LAAVEGEATGWASACREVVLRPRLLSILQLRWERRLVALVAGPGFGKTTLLNQALAQNQLVTRGTDILVTCTAADGVVSSLAQRLLRSLSDRDLPSADPLAAAGSVAEAVWQRAPEHVSLILDDVHELPHGSPGWDLVRNLARTLPTNGHLVTASRLPGPVPAARLRSLGEVVVLGEADLTFSDAELEEFARLRQVDPSLVEGSSGWPALAELAVVADGEVIEQYLWEEVLDRMTPRDRRDLAVLAAIDGADERLWSIACGHSVDARALLRGLPLATSDRRQHRLHRLWAAPLESSLDPAEAAAARRRAAQELFSRGEDDRALRLLCADADECPEAVAALVRIVRSVCTADHPRVPADVMAAWLPLLPGDVVSSVEGDHLRAMVALEERPADAAPMLRAALLGYQSRGDVDAELACLRQLAIICLWARDLEGLVPLVQRVWELEASGSAAARALGGLGRALLAHFTGVPSEALAELEPLAELELPASYAAEIAWLRSTLLLAVGRPDDAVSEAQAAHQGAPEEFREKALGAVTQSTWFAGDVEQALELGDNCLDDSVRSGRQHNVAVAAAWMATGHALLGDAARAADLMQRCEAAAPAVSGDSHLSIVFARAAVALVEGRDDDAAALLRASLLERPMTVQRRVWYQRAVSLIYVLCPESRPLWADVELGPSWLEGLRMAEALAAVREDGCLDPLAALDWPPPGRVRAHLPLPWATQLAVAGVAAGRSEGSELLAALGERARDETRRLASCTDDPLAPTARRLLGGLPRRPDHEIRLSVLGPVVLHVDGTQFVGADWRRERVRSLLTYLAVHGGGTRESVAAALWPDMSDDSAGRNLRVTLTRLNGVLEPDRAEGEPFCFVLQEGGRLSLRTDWIRVDLWEFREHLAAANDAEVEGVPSVALEHLLAAESLYRDEAFSGLRCEEWGVDERERLRGALATTATRAGELLLARGDIDEAVRLAGRAIDSEPWSERAHRLLAAGHLANGDRPAALRALQRCRSMLDELGADPEPATSELTRRVASIDPHQVTHM
jgi:LuxR family transcriptional regulator, maltose regulon positive regulatory protein